MDHESMFILDSRISAVLATGLALLLHAPGTGQENDTDLTTATSALFSGSGNCAVCHVQSRDALVAADGTDLAPPTDWRATMMANAGRDPLWQAMVEIEAEENPALAAAIENTCTRCHTPMGQVEATVSGSSTYTLESALHSPLAMDGVSCTVCHQIRPDNLGAEESFSGGFAIDGTRTIFGPYRDPLVRQMQNSVGYTPAFGEHVNDSGLCATCHTLFTPFVDDDGQITGTFPEQVPYLEWQNSVYPSAGVECQSCHMPAVEEPVKISRIPRFLEPRSPFYRHVFVGGNTFLQEMLRDNGAELGVTATSEHFHTTIARTREQLRERTVRLEVETAVEDDRLVVTVHLENLTGHKFPTAFPSRRAWLRVLVTNEREETIFASGEFDPDGRITGLDGRFEPHRDLIDSGSRVQIYELVVADVNGERTSTLLRAASQLKDNRIPPRGFRSGAERYDDVEIVGNAATDANFNRDGETEGTGRDTVTYLVDTSGQAGRAAVEVQLLFQSLAPAFADHVLEHETPAADRFARYYSAAPKMPEVIQSTTLEVDLGTGGEVPFRRGDVNADGLLDVSDVVFALEFLFTGGDEPSCRKSADSNRDDQLDVADAVQSLFVLFVGLEMPPPSSECGIDLSSTQLSCESFSPCE